MKNLKNRLTNRTDLEKLEQDLAVIERLVEEDAVGRKIKKLARQARRDLEAARSEQIDLLLRLKSPSPVERAAARQEVESRIAAGEIKMFDPQTASWRPPVDLLDEAVVYEETLERHEAEIRYIEDRLAESATEPPSLHQLHHLILQAESLLNQRDLSENGKKALEEAKEVYEAGCTRHRGLTLKIHNGTLKDRFDALGKLHEWITNGELWILDAPDEVWRKAEDVLLAAEQSCAAESARLCDEVINQAESLANTNLTAALQDVYTALDRSIPYIQADRARLKEKYNELLEAYQLLKLERESQPSPISPDEMAGYITIRELNQDRIKKLINQSLGWVNQFFHSAITRPVAALLDEAANEQTPPARTVELIDMAVGLAKDAMEGSIEIPEAMIRGAVILYNKGITNRVSELLSSALPLYTLERADKIHRHAMTAWLLGCVDYALGRRLDGYSNWKNARRLFEDLLAQAIKDKQAEKADWYRARLKDMSIYASQTFEDVYFNWLNQFEMIAYPESMKDYRMIMDSQLEADQIVQLKKTLLLYLGESKTLPALEPNWAAWIDAAFYQYEIRDNLSTLESLNQAWVGFQSSHRGAIVLWLSGLVQWWFPSKIKSAINNWETSIRIFTNLSKEADQNNQNNRHTWYDNQIELMTISLKEWVQLTKLT